MTCGLELWCITQTCLQRLLHSRTFLPMFYDLPRHHVNHIFPTIQAVFLSLRNFYIAIDSLCFQIMSYQSISYSLII